MTRLEDLLYSLTSIIVQYHDSQSSVTKLVEASDKSTLQKKSRDLAIDFIEDRVKLKGFVKGNVHANLEKLIKDCTNGYPDRRPFLYFILHEINFIKSIRDYKAPIDPIKLEKYKLQIAQLLINFKSLLTTPKSKMVQIKRSKIDDETDAVVSLSGLKSDAYLYGGEYCNSGSLVKEDVLDRLNILVGHSNEEIVQIVSNICAEYQNTLLVPYLQSENRRLTEEAEKAKSESSLSSGSLKESEKTIQSHLSKIQELEKTIEGLKVRVSDLSHSKGTPSVYNPALFPYYGTMFGPLGKLTRPVASTQPTDTDNKSSNPSPSRAIDY
ncbi:hypothetical protein [Legionella waltersii]|uniref:Uncharacterized protein n=1 Tax=Legionella waltersii TaxID=66969 RepID=A0A0W1ANK1_9GAMM|nr:hypothetical protein [Legionella waltersii]KTD82918.1 hypothetical protein Lwal_0396 [Legionella waltersii]SNV02249.1 Uncharacterised protein [Legionella waltersii]